MSGAPRLDGVFSPIGRIPNLVTSSARAQNVPIEFNNRQFYNASSPTFCSVLQCQSHSMKMRFYDAESGRLWDLFGFYGCFSNVYVRIQLPMTRLHRRTELESELFPTINFTRRDYAAGQQYAHDMFPGLIGYHKRSCGMAHQAPFHLSWELRDLPPRSSAKSIAQSGASPNHQAYQSTSCKSIRTIRG